MAINPRERIEIRCCKKWVNGEIKKYYSRGPCSAGAVQCSDPDPPKPIDGDGDGKGCIERCEEQRDRRTRRGRPSPGAEEAYRRCIARCGDGGGDDGDKCEPGYVWSPDLKKCVRERDDKECEKGWHWSPKKKTCVPDDEEEDPCRWGQGYKNAAYQADLPCDKGWHPVTTEDGEKWCCPDQKKPGQGPCSGEGHEIPFGTSQCEEGFSIKKADDGTFWCCKDEDGGGGDCDPGWHWDEDLEKCVIDREDNCPTGTHWSEYVEECVDDDDDNGNGNGGGEFEWGEGLQGLLGRIQERANYLLDYPRGLTPQERQGVINYAIESVKSGERGRLQSSQDLLSRRGLLGSGFEFEEAGRIKRETRASETQIRRELAIDDLDRRFSELMGTTGMAQSLTGTLMQGEQIPEILSGARRAEGSGAINSLLMLLSGSMGGQNNQYWQAIINQLMGSQGGGGSGIMDWLPWLLASSGGTRQRI